MADEGFWIITTFAFLATTVLSGLVALSFWLFMKQEGRFFFMGNFDNKGIDVIRHEPLSNRLRLIRVKWNGKFFQYGKEMMFFGIEKIINPDTDPKKQFNDVVSRMCTWAGSKRPVLVATDIMSHLITPELLALVAKSRKHNAYNMTESKLKKIFTPIKTAFNKNKGKDEEEQDPEIVTYLETMKPDDLTEFMEDISARDTWDAYQTGKRVNELERSKGMELGKAAKIVISVAAIGIVLLIIYLVASGRLTEIIDTVAN